MSVFSYFEQWKTYRLLLPMVNTVLKYFHGNFNAQHYCHPLFKLLRINFPYSDPSGRSLAGIAGSNPTGGMDACLL
jgi:hypothetical protein